MDLNEGETIFQILLLIIMIIFAVIGNSMTCYVIYSSRGLRSTYTGLLVANLAISDLLLGSIFLPFGIPSLLYGYWPLSESSCSFLAFLNQVFCVGALLTLTVVSYDRYHAIVRPLYYTYEVTTKKIVLTKGGIWSIAMFTAFLPVLGWGGYSFDKGSYLCVTDFKADPAFTYFNLTICFGVPLQCIFFVYFQIFKVARAQRRQIKINTIQILHSEARLAIRRMKTETKAALTLLTVVGIFMLCLAPFTIHTLYALHTDGIGVPQWDLITSRFAYINSALNPLVYGVMNKTYRRGYFKIMNFFLRCKRLGRSDVTDFGGSLNSEIRSRALSVPTCNRNNGSDTKRISTSSILAPNRIDLIELYTLPGCSPS